MNQEEVQRLCDWLTNGSVSAVVDVLCGYDSLQAAAIMFDIAAEFQPSSSEMQRLRAVIADRIEV